MTKCEQLETELIMQNSNLLWYQYQFIQLLTQSKSTVVLKRANTGGATKLRKGLVGQIKGLVGKFPTTLYGKNALINVLAYRI